MKRLLLAMIRFIAGTFLQQTALLPVYPDLLAVRDRGHREIRRDQGRLAGV